MASGDALYPNQTTTLPTTPYNDFLDNFNESPSEIPTTMPIPIAIASHPILGPRIPHNNFIWDDYHL